LGLAAEVRGRANKRWTRPMVDEILGPKDAAELAQLLSDRAVPAQWIWYELRDRGIAVSESSVQKWANVARRPKK
jgi:hypothetical protein